MTRKVMCGDVAIGGGAPISIQSMTNIPTCNEKQVIEQIWELQEAGCGIVRLAVNSDRAAEAFGKIKKQVQIPMVADIHFDYRLAIAAIKNGADKIRINPGNIGDEDRIRSVALAARAAGIPIRVGVNSGSLEKELLAKHGGPTAQALSESALNNARLLEKHGFEDIVISLKSSDVRVNTEAYRLISQQTDYPLHIGVTEAGTLRGGVIKSSIGIGALLLDGIGDTVRVSLTADPIEEIYAARSILKSLGLMNSGVNLISCPTCGRTRVGLETLADEIEGELGSVEADRDRKGLPALTVAIMGCEVNGPGEAAEADLGVACGKGEGLIFIKGKSVRKVPEAQIKEEIIRMVSNYENL